MSDIHWQPVESSAVAQLGWTVEGEIETKEGVVEHGSLFVLFHSGTIYQYRPCIRPQFEVLCSAESVGRSLWKVLVPGTGRKVWQREGQGDT